MKREKLEDGRVLRVVRHDLVKGGGGTKSLVVPAVVADCYRCATNRFGRRVHKYAYASPSFGFAQVAIGAGCRALGYEGHIFLPKRRELTPISIAAEQAGAVLHQIDPGYLAVCTKRARDFADQVNGVLLPFGLMCEPMLVGIENVARGLNIRPREVWLASASGTLWQGLARAWPRAFFQVVTPGKKQDTSWTAKFPDMHFELWEPPEKFHQTARTLPPYPSAENYDAKIWQFVIEYAIDGAVVWNVAG